MLLNNCRLWLSLCWSRMHALDMHELRPQPSTYDYINMYRRSVRRYTQRQDRWTLNPKRYEQMHCSWIASTMQHTRHLRFFSLRYAKRRRRKMLLRAGAQIWKKPMRRWRKRWECVHIIKCTDALNVGSFRGVYCTRCEHLSPSVQHDMNSF